jgi:cytochrome c oxidase subunit 2
LNPSGPVAHSEANLFWFILVVATIVFVVVESLLIYSIVRFRERPNTPAPVQTHGNNTVEIIWTIVPSFFLFIVLVIHSFWVPELFGKTDVVPGHNNMSIFQADNIGTYRGQCTEFCGLQHAHMNFYVIVKSQDDYNSWLTSQEQSASSTPTDPTALAGQKLFLGSGGCQGCHGIVGVNLKDDQHLNSGADASILVGPNLTHFGSRRNIAGAVLQWDPASCVVVTGSNGQPTIQNPDACGLYQWLKDPQAVKPGNDMVIRSLSDTEIAQLIAYLESLK